MTIANPVGIKTNGQTISGTEVTAIGAALEKAADFVGGGAYTISAPVSVTGKPFHSGNSSAVADSAAVTIDYATSNIYRVPDLSQNLILTLKSATPTPPTDAKITVVRTQTDPDFTVAVKRADTTLLATLPIVTGSPRSCSWVEFSFTGIKWIPCRWGQAGTGLSIDINEA